MILQYTAVRVSKMSEGKAAARLKSHLKYLQYQQHSWERGQAKKRQFFNDESDHVHRPCIHQSIMHRQTGNVYYYCLLLTPAHDEPVNNWHQWTRAILFDLENRFEQTLNWYAVVHNETETPHIHILLRGAGKNQRNGQDRPVTFKALDFAFLREQGRIYSEYRLQQLLREQLCFLDLHDTT